MEEQGINKSGQSLEAVDGNGNRKTTHQDTRSYSKGGWCPRILQALLALCPDVIYSIEIYVVILDISRLQIGLVIFFAVTTVVISAVLIWRENRHSYEPITSESLQKAYPGYFRTQKEQNEFEIPIAPVPASENMTTVGFTCNVNCAVIPQRRRRNAADTSYNGCCESSKLFVSPTTLENLDKQIRELVKGDDTKQFFQTAQCRQSIGCAGCTCMLDREMETAVVYKLGKNSTSASYISDTEIDKFHFNKCCKCVNIGVN